MPKLKIGQKGYDFSKERSTMAYNNITLLLRYFCSEFKYH